MCKVKLAHNTQERSLTGGQVPYIKELTEQEEFTRKLFGLSNPTIINGGSDMGMSEDIQLPMDTSDGDGEELVAASEIPERANEEGTEVNTSQQCGMAAAVEEGEECQEGKMSDLEGSVGGLKLNIMACVKEESCDDPAAVVEGGRSELSVDEEPAALGAESPPSPQAHGQHQAHAAGEENEDDLKHLERLHQEQVQSTESYQASSNLLLQTLTEFKMDVSQNLQRNNEILQQQNEILCQLLQRSNETLNEMRQILSQIVVPTPYGQQQPSAETSTAGHAFGTGEWDLEGLHRTTPENAERTPQIDPDHLPKNNCITVGRHPIPSQHCSTQRRLGSESSIWKSIGPGEFWHILRSETGQRCGTFHQNELFRMFGCG
ncbi:hypothetical protein scyTo_0015132 [Scyliorhinus torazame]|uniref:Uncharacterized protein n=1 Tax=Scyliorhinus torazame TaxID=75743 RepID=A0A401P3B5_SCYTO|nr:hypothetical protein [Scyliorhinus torazame]